MIQKKRRSKSTSFIEELGCRYVPAIYTGNVAQDSKANSDLYLKLVKEGEVQGVCPVLVERDIERYAHDEQYGFSDCIDKICCHDYIIYV